MPNHNHLVYRYFKNRKSEIGNQKNMAVLWVIVSPLNPLNPLNFSKPSKLFKNPLNFSKTL